MWFALSVEVLPDDVVYVHRCALSFHTSYAGTLISSEPTLVCQEVKERLRNPLHVFRTKPFRSFVTVENSELRVTKIESTLQHSLHRPVQIPGRPRDNLNHLAQRLFGGFRDGKPLGKFIKVRRINLICGDD